LIYKKISPKTFGLNCVDEEWKSKLQKVMSDYPPLNQFMAYKMKYVKAGNPLTED
jgi:hypothetical protein